MTNNTTNSSTEEFQQLCCFLDWHVFGIAVRLLIFLVNLATILTFVINRHLLRRSVYCLINLAVADMLFGMSSVIISIILNGHSFGPIYIFWDFVTLSLLSISLLSLVVVSLDRVYATFFPFRHRTTRLRMYIAVFTITWLLPLPIMIIFQLRFYKSLTIFAFASVLILFLICLVIICTSYTAIFVQVKIQAKRLQPNQQQTDALQRRQKRKQHLAMTLFIVTVLSLITWLPYIICVNLLLFSSQRSNILHYLFKLSFLLRDTNSLFDPIVYVFRMRDFRRALKKLIFKCSRDQQQIPPIGHHGNHDRQQQPPIELQEM